MRTHREYVGGQRLAQSGALSRNIAAVYNRFNHMGCLSAHNIFFCQRGNFSSELGCFMENGLRS